MKNKGIKILVAMCIMSTMFIGCSSQTADAKTKTQITQISTVENNQTQDNSQIETYFTKKDGNLNQVLIKEINTAQKNLDVAIYSLTKDDIANAIIEAKKRGVDVKVITDKQESQSKYQKAILDKFKQTGIPVKINNHAGLMHLKLSIIDNKTALGGSYNYSEQATRNNDENLIVMRQSDIVGKYSDEFNIMWNNTSDYLNY